MTFNLDKFQIQAIDSINKDFNVLVVAPTGSGKTYIAEKAIEKYTKQNQNVIYTTPIKALSNQKYNDFTNLNIDTGLLTGDRTLKPDSELIVATTEILRNMIYSNDERLKQIGLIVLDEVHYLSDSERGTTWEEIIIHAPKNIKFLFLSATIRNKEEFHSWIVSLRGKTDLVHSNIRPVPLEISLVGLNPHNEQLKIIKSSKEKRNNKIFKFEKQYRRYKRPHLGFQLDYLDNKQLTPSIFFYFSRDRVETKARQATTNRKKIKEAEEVRKLFNNVFDSLDPVEYELLNLCLLYTSPSPRDH